jgi:hypothetical protein
LRTPLVAAIAALFAVPSTPPMHELTQILVRDDVDHKKFREEIMPAARPVVLKGLLNDWPAVRAAREGPRALADFIRKFDQGKPVFVIECPRSTGGRLFYREDMSGLNFTRFADGRIGATLDRLLSVVDDPDAPAIFLESMRIEEFLPDFAAAHVMPLVPPTADPRIWIGNAITVQTHYDLLYNVACVVGGRRRFTLFPPEQVANLYMGPVDFTPSGTPISMAPLYDADPVRFPRFAEALRHAQQTELGSGDALYIPYGWWHHVESLTQFNVLVNYWWNPTPKIGSPYAVLLHAALSLRDLPPDQREVWHGLFEHLVFTAPDEALAHLAPDKRGLLGPPSAERMREVRSILAATFNRPPG